VDIYVDICRNMWICGYMWYMWIYKHIFIFLSSWSPGFSSCMVLWIKLIFLSEEFWRSPCLELSSVQPFNASLEIRCQFYQCSTSSFYARRSWKHKKILMTWLYFFTILVSVRVKAASKMLVKLTPGVNFTTCNHFKGLGI